MLLLLLKFIFYYLLHPLDKERIYIQLYFIYIVTEA